LQPRWAGLPAAAAGWAALLAPAACLRPACWPAAAASRCRTRAPRARWVALAAGPRPPLPRACTLPRWPTAACQPARAQRRARPACRCHASCRLLGHALAAALGRARAHACWAAPALALLGRARAGAAGLRRATVGRVFEFVFLRSRSIEMIIQFSFKLNFDN